MFVAGPFAPGRKASDGWILTHSWLTDAGFRRFMENPGVVLVDYGFRGAYTPMHVELRMPVKSNSTQAYADFNSSVTRDRWIIEAVNQRLNVFALFKQSQHPWSTIVDVKGKLQCVSFILNRYWGPIGRRSDLRDHDGAHELPVAEKESGRQLPSVRLQPVAPSPFDLGKLNELPPDASKSITDEAPKMTEDLILDIAGEHTLEDLLPVIDGGITSASVKHRNCDEDCVSFCALGRQEAHRCLDVCRSKIA